MWRCKECGGTDFSETSIRRQELYNVNYDENGKIIYSEEYEEIEPEVTVRCEGCGDNEEWIGNIAEWVE